MKDTLRTQIALGPLLYYWPRQATLDFYAAAQDWPVDIVYLGETVCSRRHELRLDDWLGIADRLAAAGKQAVLSSLALIESESDLKTLRRLVAQAHPVEANDMSAVRLLAEAGRRDWVAGPSLNVFNPATLSLLIEAGACRWVGAPEIAGRALADLRTALPQPLETEVLYWGRVPLAHSARCFTARHFNLQKDNCAFRCLSAAPDADDGQLLRTREGEAFLTLNGVQTQSARVLNLLADHADVAGVADILRISPQRQHTHEILATCHDLVCRRLPADAAFARSQPWMAERPCNGFWHGRPGADYLPPGAADAPRPS